MSSDEEVRRTAERFFQEARDGRVARRLFLDALLELTTTELATRSCLTLMMLRTVDMKNLRLDELFEAFLTKPPRISTRGLQLSCCRRQFPGKLFHPG